MMNSIRPLLVPFVAALVVACGGTSVTPSNTPPPSVSAVASSPRLVAPSSEPSPPDTAASAPTTGGVQIACVYPNAAELAALARASDAVVVATVGAAELAPLPDNGRLWTYPLRDVTVLVLRPGMAVPSSVQEIGSPTQGLLSQGRTVLFLTWNGASFYATGGTPGVFPVTSAGRVERYCVNYEDPAHPNLAAGTPLTEPAFRAQILAVASPLPTH